MLEKYQLAAMAHPPDMSCVYDHRAQWTGLGQSACHCRQALMVPSGLCCEGGFMAWPGRFLVSCYKLSVMPSRRPTVQMFQQSGRSNVQLPDV